MQNEKTNWVTQKRWCRRLRTTTTKSCCGGNLWAKRKTNLFKNDYSHKLRHITIDSNELRKKYAKQNYWSTYKVWLREKSVCFGPRITCWRTLIQCGSPKETCIVNAYCQFSQQVRTNFIQTYLHCYNINLFLCINDQFALSSTHVIKQYYE